MPITDDLQRLQTVMEELIAKHTKQPWITWVHPIEFLTPDLRMEHLVRIFLSSRGKDGFLRIMPNAFPAIVIPGIAPQCVGDPIPEQVVA